VGSADDFLDPAVGGVGDVQVPVRVPDRKAAADRIITAYPRWSDRAIASVTGLSRTQSRRAATVQVQKMHT
jgi:hypothetical protein